MQWASDFVGHYDVYDGMTFPEEEATSLFDKIRRVFKSVEEDKLKTPNHSQAQEDSLLIFLEPFGKRLRAMNFSINSDFKFLKCIGDIFQIYEQLRCQKIISKESPENRMAATDLAKVLMYIYSMHV